MGKMNVLSGLGQPLLAEIDLVSVQEDELSGMVARLASPEMFREAQLQYPSHLSGLKFSIEKRSNGTRYVKVVSNTPVSEPFIDVLIELNWQTGRLVREFTALLDPLGDQSPKIDQSRVPQTQVVTSDSLSKSQAGAAASGKPGRSFARKGPRVDEPGMPEAFKAAKAAEAAKPAAVEEEKPAPSKAAPAPVAPTPKAKPIKEVKEAPKEVAKEAKPAEDADGYKVKAGETLAQIAQKIRHEGVSLEQMLVGLYQNNQDAFLNGNMNRLRAGKILNVPAKDKVESLTQAEAIKEIKTHSTDWNSYRQKLAETVEKAPSDAGSAAKSSASGKLAAKVEDKAAPAAGSSKEVLKLSRGDEKGKASAGLAAQQDKNAAAEDQIAREKALKDANDRVSNLQKNIQEMQKLLEMKNKGGADLQAQSAKPAEKPAEAEKAAAPAAAPAPEAAKPADSAAVPAAPVSEKPLPPIEPPKPATPAAKPVAPPPAPVAEPGMLDSLLQNPLLLGGGLAGLGLLGGIGFLLAKRRKRPSFEDSIITGGDLKANTVLGNTGGAIINTNATESSFLTDFSRAGLGTIDTDEVDPIAEAEVYMAYGRDAQAEEILKDALAKDPSRQEIRAKLLEIYAGRKNTASFEEVASELYSATDGKGPLWASAAQMGRELDPANPLYKQGSGEAVAQDEFSKTQVLDRSAAASAVVAEDMLSAEPDLGLDVAEPQSNELDFDLDTPAEVATVATPEPAAADSNVLDFDIGDFSVPEVKPVVEEVVAVAPAADFSVEDLPEMIEEVIEPAAAPADKQMLDFDFQLDAPVAEVEAAAPLDLDNVDLSLELPPLEETPEPTPQAVVDLGLDDSDPMSTKIDLARAYLDMGDKEGAREILLEVMQDGSAEHQAVAKPLLDQI
ncbi:MAG: FimV/HubP family polar landmark protein [Chitinivorax sp.]